MADATLDQAPPVELEMEDDYRADLDDYSDDEKPHAPETITERRRAQKSIFDQWLTSDVGLEALKPKVKEEKLLDGDDEELSIHSLLAKQGADVIQNPRQYQIELFERAQVENTIAVLDTGSGKTLIAVMLLQWTIDQELERRAQGKRPRVSFFLVASVTLLYQQFAVLERALDRKVARVCGNDNVDKWQKSRWQIMFDENKVIIATADVLHQCLAHSYVSMEQINLLIFDEAHHAKKNHAYARIIKDFYIEQTDPAKRPRVFGMTASPIDAKTDVVQTASELETLLHCKIATTNHMSLHQAVKKPREEILKYPALPTAGVETPLLKSIKARFEAPAMFDRIFKEAVDIAKHLGRWCADMYLADALSERKLKRFEFVAEREHHHKSTTSTNTSLPSPPSSDEGFSGNDQSRSTGVKQLDAKLALIRNIIDFVQEEQKKYLECTAADFSPKVHELKKYLRAEYERPTSNRCIVFVDARNTARLLYRAFERLSTAHMKPGFLTGSNSPGIGEDNLSFRQQVLKLMKFRNGTINCLFATSVAEEGLDVPDCNLVIRFDMYRTMIQYVQSRGRARHENSKFIHMIELGNSIHKELLHQVRYNELQMKKFCEMLPEDRQLQGNNDHLEALMEREKGLRVYIDPITKAKLTYGNALVCLANFVSAIPTETGELLHPTYIVGYQGSKFTAEVLLPGDAPIRSAIGRVCTKKSLAKRSAAFEACIQLREKEYLNEHLMPTYEKRVHLMRNAMLAVNMKKTNRYLMRTKPSVWAETRGSLPTELYVTLVDFPDGLEHAHQPIVMATRTAMPSFPEFPIFMVDGRASAVRTTAFAKPIVVSERRLEQMSSFTFRVWQDLFDKKYEYLPPDLSYWLLPGFSSAADTKGASACVACVDWELLDQAFGYGDGRWSATMPAQSLVGRFIIDSFDGARKFITTATRPDLHPLTPLPPDAAKPTGTQAKYMHDILNYSNSMFKNTRKKHEDSWNTEQPVFEAHKVNIRRNLLAEPNAKEAKLRTKTYICLEPLRISVIPPAFAIALFAWPSIIHRLEEYLIAIEACNMIGINCSPEMALAAMTKDSDNSGEHEAQERVNFRHGMGENYERLEFIGDTFLKTATTISTFIQNPNDNEAEFHTKRMLMLCNQNLFNVAIDLKLYEYIRSIAFSRRLWYPEGLNLLEGKGAGKIEETSVQKHNLGEKTIADVCEALIGAAYITHDRPGKAWKPEHWEDAVRAVTKLVGNADHTMMQWDDYRRTYQKPEYQTGEVSASQRDLAEKVELEHAYHFRYPRLLRSAFLHPSQPTMYEKVPNYQRLEFLGDALLDMASITHLFYRFPDKDPQWLTEHKMAMVSNKFLGAVCVNIGFHKHTRHSHSILQHQIGNYADELLEAKRIAGDARDYWTTVSDPPKCLPDMVEAFIGAMFIDSDFDYSVVQDFFEKHIKWYFDDMSIYDSFANNHPCTHLHHLLDSAYGCQAYRLMAREVPSASLDAGERKDILAVVMVHETIVAHSKGKSGRYARLRVAHQALQKLEGMAPYEFRHKFGCACSLKDGQDVAMANAVVSGDDAVGSASVVDCTV